MNYLRQQTLVNMPVLSRTTGSLVGAGALGSFIALTISKMGINSIEVFDEDGVDEHNLPSQFYKKEHAKNKNFKVDALKAITNEFSDTKVTAKTKFYDKQRLKDIVIVATDSMASRKKVWEEFKKQKQCKYYIEVRMGGEIGILYSITNRSKDNYDFYEKTLYSDEKAVKLPCTAKSIIYNVLMISALAGRAVKAIVNREKFPRELIFDIGNIYENSFLIRK